MTDYTVYALNRKEKFQYMFIGYLGTVLLFYLFYQNLFISLPAGIIGAFSYPAYRKKTLAGKRRWQLMMEFKDAMDSMVSALVAGYSMENAVGEAYRDLRLMYEEDTPMLRELKNLNQKIRLQQPLDKLLLDFGRRSGVEDILTFAQIYATARRSGGNLVQVMKRTAANIGEKMEIQREIRTMSAGKRMEASCMMLIPLLIILYMQFFSPGFLDPLYESAGGKIFMSIVLVIYLLMVAWSRSIMRIEC